jgi:transposase
MRRRLEVTLKIMTILGAMSANGMVATMTIEEPTDTDIFLAYIEHILYPVLKPGHVVVMDNLSAHKAPAVRLWIEKAGAELLYLLLEGCCPRLLRQPGYQIGMAGGDSVLR